MLSGCGKPNRIVTVNSLQGLLDDADIVYDAYYQKTGLLLQSCDFGGSATNSALDE